MRSGMKAVCVVAVIAGMASAAAAQASFVGLGIHPNFGGMSSDGSTAIGWISGTEESVIWTAANGLEFIQPPTGFDGVHFRGISGDGSVIAGYASAEYGSLNQQVAFRYTRSGGYEWLEDLGPPGEARVAAVESISRDGSTVVGTGRSGNAFPVRWAGSIHPEVLGPGLLQPNGAGAAVAASADGTVIAAFGINRSFRWTAATGLQLIAPLSAQYASPTTVSDDGTVIAGGAIGWRWTEADGFMALPSLSDGRSPGIVNAMSADGKILAGGSVSTSAQHGAFYWTAETGTRYVHEVMAGYGIDLTGWSIRTVQGMSADGRSFMGDGINPQGQWETWYATIPQPLPAPGAVVVFGLAGVVVARRRR